MEKITGMKINRERPGKKMQKPPREIDFFNSEGRKILSIHISQHSKTVSVHPHGADVTIFEYDKTFAGPEARIYKHSSEDRNWVTTNDRSDGERVFPENTQS